MNHIRRPERIAAMVRLLTGHPNRIYTLSGFSEKFGAAKSSVSEDLNAVREAFSTFDLGKIDTVPGAAGGVRYRPVQQEERAQELLEEISRRLMEPGRKLPGGFLYTLDITAQPDIAESMGEMLAQRFYDKEPDIVLTMETKGIPIALMTARALNVPLVVARRDSAAYEGSAVRINYIGGNGGMETMSLARRSVLPGQRVLIIDDFMKVGGALRGLVEMMREFEAEVVGMGVMIATAEPREKRVQGVQSLLTLDGFDRATQRAVVRPAK